MLYWLCGRREAPRRSVSRGRAPRARLPNAEPLPGQPGKGELQEHQSQPGHQSREGPIAGRFIEDLFTFDGIQKKRKLRQRFAAGEVEA